MKTTIRTAKLLARQTEYRIHSTYRNTVNILAGGRILALHPDTISPTPLSVVFPQKDFGHITEAAGKAEVLYITEKELIIRERRWETGERTVWNPVIDRRLTKEERHVLLQALETVICREGPRFGGMSDSAFCRGKHEGEDLVRAALRDYTGEILKSGAGFWERILSPAEAMIGLGIGLTPSGDDFLTGLLLGFFLCGEEGAEPAALLTELLQKKSDRTNDISRQYLLCACEREFSLKYHLLFPLLDEGIAEEGVEFILQTGHSSGLDCLNGLAAGLLLMKETEHVCQK